MTKELELLLILEVDCVVARARVLLKIEVVRRQSEGIEHHVPQLLQVAQHLLFQLLVFSRNFRGKSLKNSQTDW